MHPALTRTDHRPWPLPTEPWRWRQSWCDLLFAHWPVSAAALRPLVPRGVEIEEFDGTSWVGIVPFRMTGVMHRPLPDIPGISAFAELNVRLYVRVDDKPGVWFVSLDAANRLAVTAARALFHLPYFHAAMSVEQRGEHINYSSRRLRAARDVRFTASYRPTGPPVESTPGSIEHFLTERYCLYTTNRGGDVVRGEVHHLPWPLQTATAEITENTMASAQDIALDGAPVLLHFARRLDVIVWGIRPLRAGQHPT